MLILNAAETAEVLDPDVPVDVREERRVRTFAAPDVEHASGQRPAELPDPLLEQLVVEVVRVQDRPPPGGVDSVAEGSQGDLDGRETPADGRSR